MNARTLNGGGMHPESSPQEWPEELDALRAAPKHHALLFENEAVRVLDTRVAPGETVPLHTHRWPGALYIMSWSDFVRRDGEGTVVADSRSGGKLIEGSAVWSGPLAAHTLENVGASELCAISVEVKGSK
jgi:quercetin dioxygenase-like cupin family protein